MPEIPQLKQYKYLFLREMKKDPFSYLENMHRQYGEIFSKKVLEYSNYYLSHPKFAEQILYNNQDNYHKHPFLKRVLKPLFGENNLFTTDDMPQWDHDRNIAKKFFDIDVYFNTYSKTIVDKTAAMLDQWEKQLIQGNRIIKVDREMDLLALSIVKDTLFQSLDFDAETLVEEIPNVMKQIVNRMTSFTDLPWKLPTKKRRNYRKAVKLIETLSSDTMCERLASHRDFDDLLGEFFRDYNVTGIGSPDFSAISNHLIFVLFSGYITTASTLIATLMELAKHPTIAKKISDEVTQLCRGNPPTYQQVSKLKFTQAVIKEVMRLHPTIFRLMRQTIEEDTVMGYPLPAGSCLSLNSFLIHRHPDYWESPNDFKPERFLNKPWGQDCKFAYLPFGGGKRSCIAQNFAQLELCLILAMVVQKFQLFLPQQDKEIKRKFFTLLITRPDISEMLIERSNQ